MKSDNTEDTGVRWNNRQFQNIMPNLALEWHELTATEWGEEPDDYTVYINLTATYHSTHDAQADFHGQYEVSLEPKEENRSVKEGTNSISATYVVGTLKYRNGYKVDQNILGEQTFIEMFDDNAISSAVDDIVPEVLSSYLPKVDSEVPLLELSSIGKYSYEDEKEGEKDVYEIHQFHNLNNQVPLNEERKKYSDIIIRTRSNTQDKKPAIVEYLPLSALSASSAAEISVDSDFKNQTSSLQMISKDDDEWYQLYNFDKTSTDLTVATDLNGPGRWYAPAPTGLTDTSALFLIKDTKSKELKYAQLSVSPPAVDNRSIQRFWSPDFPGQPQMLSLNRFWEHPLDGTLTGVLSSNKQVVDFNGDNGTFLMQGYRNGQLGLKYMHLQLSVDLSSVSADVRCDADVTLA